MKKAVLLEKDAIDHGDVSWDPVLEQVETEVYGETTEEEKIARIGDAEIVFDNKLVMDEEVFNACPNIKYIGICATGYNVVDLEAARRHGIIVTNVPAYSTSSVSQHAWALILELASRIRENDHAVRSGEWSRSGNFSYWITPVMQLEGKTLGIYGFGNIGRRVAKIARAFDMNILAYTAHPSKYRDKYGSFVTFTDEDGLYGGSDIITYHCPLTPATEKTVRAENIAKMKDGVMIVNVSRGMLVDEQDLADALKSGKVAAAAVDVLSQEPITEDNPLLTAPNMVITPHMAWSSLEARTECIRVISDNLSGYLSGHLQNVVS